MPTSTLTPTATPADPLASIPTLTPTPVPAHTLSGAILHVGSLVATGAEDGRYVLRDVPEGRQQVQVAAMGHFHGLG